MTECKGILNDWYKETSGGPGLDKYFESWSEEKLNKYDINLETYDHTIVSDRPPILIENYICDAVKKTYLTVIHMWDDLSHNLLSSKFDPFVTKGGEVGVALSSDEEINSPSQANESLNTSNKKSKRTKKRKHGNNTSPQKNGEEDILIAVKVVISMLREVDSEKNVVKYTTNYDLEDLPLKDLYDLMEQHKGHPKFLQESNMCKDEEKKETISHVKE